MTQDAQLTEKQDGCQMTETASALDKAEETGLSEKTELMESTEGMGVSDTAEMAEEGEVESAAEMLGMETDESEGSELPPRPRNRRGKASRRKQNKRRKQQGLGPSGLRQREHLFGKVLSR